jgi:methyl-accepting chemotaxis protein
LVTEVQAASGEAVQAVNHQTRAAFVSIADGTTTLLSTLAEVGDAATANVASTERMAQVTTIAARSVEDLAATAERLRHVASRFTTVTSRGPGTEVRHRDGGRTTS